MFKSFQFLTVFIGLMMAFNANAENATNEVRVKYGKAQFSGKGCVKKSASFTPSPDGDSFSILFDNMVLESDKGYAHKDCTLMVPVRLPKGYRLDVQTLDLRGFVHLERLSAAQIGVYPRFMNRRGKMKEGGWHMVTRFGEESDGFTETFNLGKKGRSHCGGDVQWMIIHNRVALHSWRPQAGVENIVALDSVDGAGQIRGKISVSKCK